MDRQSAKGKKRANAAPGKANGIHSVAEGMRAQEKGARAQVQASEKGVCIICGKLCTGTPAANEFPIRAARRLRSVFKQPAKHTVACKEHLAEAKEKRAKFEKKVRDYRLGAVLVFVFIILGDLFFGRVDAGMFAPALLSAFFVALLAYFYYFPSFGK